MKIKTDYNVDMINLLLVSNVVQRIKDISHILANSSINLVTKCDELSLESELENNLFDIVLIDTAISDVDILALARKIKLTTQNTQILLIMDARNINSELMKLSSGFIQTPIVDEIFSATLNASLRTKHSLDILAQNNTELAKSLYQLDVLYKTSTQLAGSLSKENLIESMIEGVDKTLSFDIAYTILYESDKHIKLLINSLYPLTSTLEEAIKLRAVLNYKAMLAAENNSTSLSMDYINVQKNIKQNSYQEFDLKIFRFDSLLAEIKNGDKVVGMMEVFRKKEFAQDDATCFQTLAKQVAIPLESASLYEELKETNIKLEKLERLKSEFISIVSHELRTPLTALKNSLDIILTGKTGDVSSAMNKFLNMAKRNSVRLSGIINDLLDLSKVEAGKMEFRYELHDIKSSVEYVKNALDNLAKEKNIVITLSLDENIEKLYIDPQRIEQVITNLLSNAIKFTPNNGSIEILTSVINADELRQKQLIDQNMKLIKGDYVKISVKDSGIGIAKDDIVKVFDKFQQIENSLNRKVGGTGLGIPIAKQLVEAHRGFIWVESELNKGSTFSIAIPVLSDKNKFDIDFMNAISKAKTSHSVVGVIQIKEGINSNIGLINKIVDNSVDIIKKTDASNEIVFENNDEKVYQIVIPEADEFVLNFSYKKLVSYLQSLENNEKMGNISYCQAVYPQDGLDMEELLVSAKSKWVQLNNERG